MNNCITSDKTNIESCQKIVDYFKKIAEYKKKKLSDDIILYLRALAYADTVHDFRGDRNKFSELKKSPDGFLISKGYWGKEDIENINSNQLTKSVINLNLDDKTVNRIPSLSTWENGLVNNIENFVCKEEPTDTCTTFKNHHLKFDKPEILNIDDLVIDYNKDKANTWENIKSTIQMNLTNNQPVIIDLEGNKNDSQNVDVSEDHSEDDSGEDSSISDKTKPLILFTSGSTTTI